jgi:hypothetical protein
MNTLIFIIISLIMSYNLAQQHNFLFYYQLETTEFKTVLIMITDIDAYFYDNFIQVCNSEQSIAAKNTFTLQSPQKPDLNKIITLDDNIVLELNGKNYNKLIQFETGFCSGDDFVVSTVDTTYKQLNDYLTTKIGKLDFLE